MRARGLSAALTAVLTLAAGPLAALDLALPAGARLTAERLTEAGSYAVPTGPWREGSGVPPYEPPGLIRVAPGPAGAARP